jgi:hypothetical protein
MDVDRFVFLAFSVSSRSSFSDISEICTDEEEAVAVAAAAGGGRSKTV